jgi:hypothetical protein
VPTAAEQLDAATQDYLDNAPPFTSAAQCTTFIRACAKLILLTPAMSSNREGAMQFDIKALQKQQEDAQTWLNANGGETSGTSANGAPSSRIVRASLENFRC